MPVPARSDRLCHALAASLVAAAAAAHLAYLAFACPLDLAPDEAHYWDWSRHLDFSYYSKGPLVAWLIRLSCELVGPWSESYTGSIAFAVRLPAVVCGSLLLASLYVLCLQVYQRPWLGLALVAGALTLPIVTAGSTLMTIDAPYTCFWGWALVFAHRAVTRGGGAWEAAGLCVGLGVLAKYTMVVFVPSLMLFLLFDAERRKLLLSGGFWSMLGVAALCCAPILIWNAQHDWVTFHHVKRLAGLAPKEHSFTPKTPLHWSGPGKYVAGQAALLLGFWFLAWLGAMIAYNPLRARSPGEKLLWWLSAPMFLLFLGFSLKTGGGEPNWPVTAYVSGGVLTAAWVIECLRSRRAALRYATAAAVVLFGLVGTAGTVAAHRSDLIHPLLERISGEPTAERPYPVRRFDPTCRLRGWRTLGAKVDEIRARLREEGQEPVLAGANWSVPGELGVYCEGRPPVYSVGLMQGDRHSQYDYWPGPIDRPEAFLGRTFVIVGGVGPSVRAAFESVDEPVEVRHEENGRPIAGWTVHVCRGFKGFAERPGGVAH